VARHIVEHIAGLPVADVAGERPAVLVDGYAHGSLSMTAYTLDLRCPEAASVAAGSAPLPSPDVVPTEEAQFSRTWPRPQGSGVGQTGTG
jgi:hypothetical protein